MLTNIFDQQNKDLVYIGYSKSYFTNFESLLSYLYFNVLDS